MKTIDIEDDIYGYILAKTTTIGEDASSILRRLLGLPHGQGGRGQASSGAEAAGPDSDIVAKLRSYLAGGELKLARQPTDRYLHILAKLAELFPDRYERVLQLEGRKRSYFGLSPDALVSSGQSVSPKQIPGTRYWALTNLSTIYKKQVLRQVLQCLSVPEGVHDTVVNAIER